MIAKIILLSFMAIGIVWLVRKINATAIKYRILTEVQFDIMAANLGGQINKSDYKLQRGNWQPPEIIILPKEKRSVSLGPQASETLPVKDSFPKLNLLKIYIKETHYGSNWMPYTIFELPLNKAFLAHKSTVLQILRNELQAADIQLYRGVLQIKNNVLYFKMPLLIYKQDLRQNFENIIQLLQQELLILN